MKKTGKEVNGVGIIASVIASLCCIGSLILIAPGLGTASILSRTYDYGLWPAVIISILIFVFFMLSFLRPKNKKRYEWRSLGIILKKFVNFF